MADGEVVGAAVAVGAEFGYEIATPLFNYDVCGMGESVFLLDEFPIVPFDFRAGVEEMAGP